MDMVPQTAQDLPVRLNLGIPAQVRLFHHIHSYTQKLYQNDIRREGLLTPKYRYA